MKLRHYDLNIPNDGSDPFINCKLDRKKYAEVLTDIVKGYADGFVLAINNPWGEGKTTFVKMWRQHLINEGFPTLYFNAWENDFQQDVLVALISELSELENKPEQQFKDVLKKVVPLTGKILPSIIKHLIKRYGGDDAAQDIAEAFGEYTEDQLKELTDNYKEKKESINKFRESLEAFATEAGGDKPLVFIIDELDRCRPNYAVEVLEQIKHLFSVSGIVFVLSIDKEQLGNAIRGVYGSDRINAEEYLRRFIDLEYSIPKPYADKIAQYFFDYFSFNEFYDEIRNNRSTNLGFEKGNFLGVYGHLFSKKELSLRAHEKFFSRLRVIIKTFDKNQYSFPDVIVLLLYFKEYHNALYKDISNKKYDPQKLLNEIEPLFMDLREDDVKNSITFAISRLVYMYCNYLKNYGANDFTRIDPKSQQEEFLLKFELNQSKLESAFRNLKSDFNVDTIALNWLIDRIELTIPIQS